MFEAGVLGWWGVVGLTLAIVAAGIALVVARPLPARAREERSVRVFTVSGASADLGAFVWLALRGPAVQTSSPAPSSANPFEAGHMLWWAVAGLGVALAAAGVALGFALRAPHAARGRQSVRLLLGATLLVAVGHCAAMFMPFEADRSVVSVVLMERMHIAWRIAFGILAAVPLLLIGFILRIVSRSQPPSRGISLGIQIVTILVLVACVLEVFGVNPRVLKHPINLGFSAGSVLALVCVIAAFFCKGWTRIALAVAAFLLAPLLFAGQLLASDSMSFNMKPGAFVLVFLITCGGVLALALALAPLALGAPADPIVAAKGALSAAPAPEERRERTGVRARALALAVPAMGILLGGVGWLAFRGSAAEEEATVEEQLPKGPDADGFTWESVEPDGPTGVIADRPLQTPLRFSGPKLYLQPDWIGPSYAAWFSPDGAQLEVEIYKFSEREHHMRFDFDLRRKKLARYRPYVEEEPRATRRLTEAAAKAGTGGAAKSTPGGPRRPIHPKFPRVRGV